MACSLKTVDTFSMSKPQIAEQAKVENQLEEILFCNQFLIL